MDGMMQNWASTTIGIAVGVHQFSIASLTTATFFMRNSKMDTITYDLLLVNWQAQPHNPNVTIDFGASQYTLGSAAATARAALIANGWVITDGGGI